jgi:hypothetical membrane protein
MTAWPRVTITTPGLRARRRTSSLTALETGRASSRECRVPWWGVAPAAAAPALLVGGWTLAGRLQPHFNPVHSTISALAEPGAADRWVMTVTLVAVSSCVLLTGLALRPAAAPGRLILMAGGVAGLLVAANPQHYGGSLIHAIWAGAVFAALAIWPAAACRRGPSEPWPLRPAVAASAAAILLCVLGWFALELLTRSGQAGVAERALSGLEALWPLVVVLSCRRHPGSTPSQ